MRPNERHANVNAVPLVVLFARHADPHSVVQDLNTRAHCARILTGYLQQQNNTRMQWPAVRPDLFPIEHVWSMIGRRLGHSYVSRTGPRAARGVHKTPSNNHWTLPDRITVWQNNRGCMTLYWFSLKSSLFFAHPRRQSSLSSPSLCPANSFFVYCHDTPRPTFSYLSTTILWHLFVFL